MARPGDSSVPQIAVGVVGKRQRQRQEEEARKERARTEEEAERERQRAEAEQKQKDEEARKERKRAEEEARRAEQLRHKVDDCLNLSSDRYLLYRSFLSPLDARPLTPERAAHAVSLCLL